MAKNKSGFSIRNGIKKFFIIAGGVIVSLFLLFLITILTLKWVNPPFTAFTLQEDWESLEKSRYNLRDYWVPESELPEHLKLAAIASEDQRFWDHWGLDIEAIQKALEEHKNGKRRRGASTITQQVAKNLFLTPSQTYLRKGIEAVIAVCLEVLWSKERILEVYLNIAEFGPGIYGAGKASESFFGKGPLNLVPNESARLAAVLPNPKRFRVNPPTPFVQERSRWILGQMTQLSGIAYIQKPDSQSVVEADTTLKQESDSLLATTFTEPRIGRASIPDSMIYMIDHDPILDDSVYNSGFDASW